MRLPVAGVAKVVESLCGDCCRCMQQRLWLGRRVFVADATSATTPDEPVLQDLWPQPSAQKTGCGFPAIKLLGLLDLATGMIVQLAMMCMNVHEMSQLAGLHQMLQAGDVLLADRGFCSFAHVAMLLKLSVDAVFRMHQRQIVDFTPNRPHREKRGKFTKRDADLAVCPAAGSRGSDRPMGQAAEPDWMSEAEYALMPQWVAVRELRYRIYRGPPHARGHHRDDAAGPDALLQASHRALYGLRWEIETNFRHLKSTMKMEHLKCQTATACSRN